MATFAAEKAVTTADTLDLQKSTSSKEGSENKDSGDTSDSEETTINDILTKKFYPFVKVFSSEEEDAFDIDALKKNYKLFKN